MVDREDACPDTLDCMAFEGGNRLSKGPLFHPEAVRDDQRHVDRPSPR